jgi:hypothetical protein
MRICSLLLGLPPDQARWADRPREEVRRLEADMAEQRQVNAEREALRTSTVFVRDLVLGGASRSS